MQAQILLVEDDDRARMLLSHVLEGAGYMVSTAGSGEAALHLLANLEFDVVVADIKMRRVDGLQVLRSARSLPQPPEVILLTGFGTLESSVAALRAGAYDYLLKPCAPPELLERVASAVQRRSAELRQSQVLERIAHDLAQLRDLAEESPGAPGQGPEAEEPHGRYLRVGDLRIDCLRHSVDFQGELLHLTPIEYALLLCLAMQPGEVCNYTEIVRHTHGYAPPQAEAQALLKPHVRNLRRKLAPSYLINMRGVGYMLAARAE